MSILRRAAEPVRDPLYRVVNRYRHLFENLIHAVKNELVDRIDQVDHDVEELAGTVSSSHTAISDQLALQAANLRAMEQMLWQVRADSAALMAEIGAARDELASARKDLSERITHAAPSVRLRELTGARLSDLDVPASAFLNYAGSHNGPLADAGLWINHPVVVEWREGSARLGAVNERIMEQPFVFAAMADLAPGSRILDIGGAESTVGLSLASLGYRVTVIEPQGYPFQHRNLTVVTEPLEEFAPDGPFDAVILLSAIEHFGIGHYAGGPAPHVDADLAAMELIADLLAPGGRLVLTTPYGPAETNNVERVYDRARLIELLQGWDIRYAAIGRRVDEVTWELESTELAEPAGPNRVVMVVATRADRP